MEHESTHSHSRSHSHVHGHLTDLSNNNRRRMLIVLCLTSTLMAVEILAAYFTGSLALLADAGHMFGDIGGLILALVAIWFASKPATADKTYGYYRSEILAGLFNAVALVVISIFVMYEAYVRLMHPSQVMGIPVLMVACLALIINMFSLKFLSQSAKSSLNMKAAYLELLGDSLAALGLIVSSLIIICTKWYWTDSLISALIALAMLPRAWILIRECINILMEGTPAHIDLANLRQAMMAVNGVVDVHDIHVWTIASGRHAMSGHITINSQAQAEAVLREVTKIINDDFGLTHSTVQIEGIECIASPEATCS